MRNKNNKSCVWPVILFISMTTLISCGNNAAHKNPALKKEFMITKEEAIKIANKNAAMYYRDLSIYEITVQPADSNWKVDYELKDSKLDGGGPHYIISGKSGEIIESHFHQ
jgi:hypothetical protein